jgi:hypothetical protein
MRHFTLLFALTSFTTSSFAQNWCPPGATWTFLHDDIFGQRIGHQLVEYIGDTVLGGSPSQRLLTSVHVYSYPQQEYLHYDMDVLYTTVQGGLVSLWDESTETFDTLMRFDAMPGDHWYVPHAEGWGPQILVTDTMHTVIDGMTLRQVVVTMNSFISADTITERLGFGRLFINPVWNFQLDGPLGPLRCYSDDEISYIIPTWQYGCASLLGIEAMALANDPVLFPNPGATSIHLTWPHATSDVTFTLSDATGRIVLHRRINETRTDLEVSSLSPGLFIWRIAHGTGMILSTGKWTKE